MPNTEIEEVDRARAFMDRTKVAVFIIAYNAEMHIHSVLDRIPKALRDKFAEVYIIDDSSTDSTFATAAKSGKEIGYNNLRVLRTPFNRGYGGNQKLGYLYALKKGFDIVVLLHGDGQYAPECLPQIINAFEDQTVSAVLGSRMLDRRGALKGGMPYYKWMGNQLLTAFENFVLNTSFAEFHTGYRAYKINALMDIPFTCNSDDFHFDTEIIIQLLATKKRISEIPIPTYYGDEVCHVNGLRYAFNCVKSVIKFRLTQVGLFYEPNFDFKLFENDQYYFKSSPNSLHQHIINRAWDADKTICELGANQGEISAILAEKVDNVTAVDMVYPKKSGKAKAVQFNLDNDFVSALGEKKYDSVIALDLIEHLSNPNEGLRRLNKIIKPGGHLYASTANIAYILIRFSLFVGHFNYGKRGILDLTHKRLFTVYSFKKILAQNGFAVKEIKAFGPPIVDLVSNGKFFGWIDSIAAFLAEKIPSLFAYNFLVVAQRLDDIDDIYAEMLNKNDMDWK